MQKVHISGIVSHVSSARNRLRMRKSHVVAASALAVSSLLINSRVSSAADTAWILSASGGNALSGTPTLPTDISGGGTGFWNVPGNWQGGATPVTGSRAAINNGGVVQIITGDNLTSSDVTTSEYQGVSFNNGSGTYQMSGGLLTVTGSLRLGEANNSSGAFNMTGGNVNLSGTQIDLGEGTGSSGVVTIGTNAAFNVSGATAFSIGTNANNTGGILNSSAAGGTGTLSITGGTLNNLSTHGYVDIGLFGSGTMNVSAGSYITTADDLNVTDGTNSTGVLNISGTGLVSLGTRALYVGKYAGGTGTVNLNGGTLSVETITGLAANNAARGTSIFNFSGGTLTVGAAGTLMQNIGTANVFAPGVIIQMNGFNTTVNQAFNHASGATTDGGLNISGAGLLTLGASTASSTMNGLITISNGTTLKAVADNYLGVTPTSLITNDITLTNGELVNGSTAGLSLNAFRGITISGTGYFEAGYANSGSGKPSTNGGLTINGPITGSGSIAQAYDGSILTLNGSDSYTGSTIIGSQGASNSSSQSYYNDGTAAASIIMRLGNANAIPTGSPVVFNQNSAEVSNFEVLDLNGISPVVGSLNTGSTSTRAVINNSSGTAAAITIDQGVASGTLNSYYGFIGSSSNTGSNAISVISAGLGTQTLLGNNTYTGSTSVTSGKLYVNGNIGSAGSPLTLSSGSTFGGAANVSSPATVTGSGTIESGYLGVGQLNLTDGLAFTGNGNITIGLLSASGANALNVSGGTLDPGGNAVKISATGTSQLLTIGSVYPLVDYTGALGSNGIAGFAVGSLPSRAVGVLVNNTSTGTSTNMIELQITGTDFIKWTGATSSGNPTGPWDTATANWKLNSTNTATMYIDNPGDAVVFDDTATGPTAITMATTLHPSTVIFNNNSLVYTLSGAGGIAGTASVTQNGTSVTTLGGTNTYTGATTINAGTLQAGSGTGISPTSAVTVANVAGATFGTGAFNVSVASINGGGSTGGTINLGSGGSLTDGGSNGNDTFAGTIAGSGSLAESGTGSLTLTGSNTYLGTTTIGASTTLNVAQVGDSPSVSNIGYGPLVLNGSFNYTSGTASTTARGVTSTSNSGLINVNNSAGVLTFSGTINASGGIAKYGPGTLILTGPYTSTGGHGLYPDGGTTIIGTGGAVTTQGYCTIAQSAGNVAILTVQGTGSLVDGGDFNICDGSPSYATLNITGSAFVQGVTTYAGKGGTDTGIVNQTGGTYNQSGTGDFRIGGGTGTGDVNSVGIWSISAGSINTNSNMQIGAYGNGELNISGTAAVTDNSGYPVVGRFNTGNGVLDVSGGTFNQTNGSTIMIIGEQGNGVLNVRGSGAVSAKGPVWIGGSETNANLAVGTVNLDGGVLSAPQVVSGAVQPSPVLSTLNFNGGTLQASANASGASFLNNLTNAYIYSAGATLDANGQAITVAQSLQAPTGLGVTSIAVTNGGSGYATAPIVQISGSGNFNTTSATAVAQMSGGQITGIIITSPGNSYSGTPTVTLLNGISGGSGATFAPVVANVAGGGLTITSSVAGGVVTLTGSNSYTGPTNVSTGTLVIASDQALPTGNNVSVAFGSTLVLPDQTAASSVSSLNINGNTIVHGGVLSTLNSSIATGYAEGNWNGTGGITSVLAATDTSHLHALGVIQNDDGTGTSTALYGSFEGQTGLADSDVLIKYTYYGDTNLDGKVDGTDYGRIDVAYLHNELNPGSPLTGWFNGDFNYDGVIDGSDYTLMDNAYNQQNGVIADQIAPPSAIATAQIASAGTSAVPEPAMFGLLGIGAFGLLGRRRRAR